MRYKEIATLKRIERISKVIEYCLTNMMACPLGGEEIFTTRYNRWMEEFDTLIKHNLTMDTSNLNVTDFMRSVICNRVGMFTEENLDWYYKKPRKLFGF